MEATKNLCAQIPLSLHARIRAEQEKSGETLSAYITTILTQYYEGGKDMDNMRTLAFQIPEELFQRLKDHLAGKRNGRGKKLVRRNLSWLSSSGRWMRQNKKRKCSAAAFCCGGIFLFKNDCCIDLGNTKCNPMD